MKPIILSILATLLYVNAYATEEITPNHQVNPSTTFKKLLCSEQQNGGKNGYTIVIDIPGNRDAQAKVYFNRLGETRRLVSSWQVKHIVNPGTYVSFANRFQKMDISQGFEDLFHLNIQTHSENGKNGIYSAVFESPSLLGYKVLNQYEKQLNRKYMNCEYR